MTFNFNDQIITTKHKLFYLNEAILSIGLIEKSNLILINH